MRARAWSAVALIAAFSTTAVAEPKPKPVDIKAIRDKLQVFEDADGGIYVALPGRDGRLWYGAGGSKSLYEQVVIGRSSDGTTGAWDLSVWAPRVEETRPGSVGRTSDGVLRRYCGEKSPQVPLTVVPADRAKTILDKQSFMSTAMIRRPYLFARDDSGVYYYVDVIRDEYGGNGFRVFVGKKGAMKQKPLTDIARDTAGDVFATKTGDIRIVRDTNDPDKTTISFIKGSKKLALAKLDVDVNSRVIYKELGIYTFTGNICETL